MVCVAQPAKLKPKTNTNNRTENRKQKTENSKLP